MDKSLDLVHRIRELSLYVKNGINDSISKEVKGVTHINGIILHILKKAEERNEALYQKDLEEKLCRSKSTMSEILNSMEKHQYIKRVPLKEDSRKKQLILTPLGKETDQKVGEVILSYELSLKNKLTKDELESLLLIMEKLKKGD